MKETKNVKKIIDIGSNDFRERKAIETKENNVNKYINYFNYKFDIYALAIAINRLHNKGEKNTIAIISENRYAWQVTYLANCILQNTIVIIPSDTKTMEIENAIKKYNIKTIFYSKRNEKTVLELYKLNKKSKVRSINLINFDSSNNPNVINYEKLLNVGRYIENSRDNNIKQEIINSKTVIINTSQEMCIENNKLIDFALKVKKQIRLWNFRPRRIIATRQINSFYEIIVEVILPMICGMNVTYITEECKKSDIYIQTVRSICEIYIKQKKYVLSDIESNFKVVKANKNKENKNMAKFQIINNNNPKKIENRKNAELVLIKDNSKVGI